MYGYSDFYELVKAFTGVLHGMVLQYVKRKEPIIYGQKGDIKTGRPYAA